MCGLHVGQPHVVKVFQAHIGFELKTSEWPKSSGLIAMTSVYASG